MTVRHLLSNDSGRFWSLESDYVELGQAPNRTRYAVGLGQQYSPGTAWAYNNAAIQVLDRVLAKATGMPTTDLAADRLFEPLGMTHTRMTRDSSGSSTNTYFGLQTTCLDLARFARLYLQQGEAPDGQRILSRGYVAKSVGDSSTRHNAAYGYLWWLNRYGLLRGATDQVDAEGQPTEPRERAAGPRCPAARCTPRSDSEARSPWSTVSHGPSWSRLGPARPTAEERLRPGGRRPRRRLGAAPDGSPGDATSRARRAGAAAGCSSTLMPTMASPSPRETLAITSGSS